MIPQPAEWVARAACVGHDPDLWFPDKGQHNTSKRARAICRECPVLDECRAFGLAHNLAGIWGGLTSDQRRAWRVRGAA